MASGLMLSPDWLALLGNNVGALGYVFLIALVLVGALYACVAVSYGEVTRRFPGPGGEAQALLAAFGRIPAFVLPLSARVTFFVCASTLVLATAGYIFNEIFVHWFPNLGFSFCLLALLLSVNLYSQRLADMAQVVSVSIAWGGLLVLIVCGLFTLGSAAPIPYIPPLPPSLGFKFWLSVIVLVGFDLLIFTRPVLQPHRLMLVALACLVGLFMLWGIVSLQYVPVERLATISIPHIVVARTILGQAGRLVIGIVALAGTWSAVNALLVSTSRMVSAMAAQRLLPGFLASASPRLALTLLAIAPALMMASGMAGEPETEVFTRAGLLLWLVLYSAIHLAALRLRRQPPALGSGNIWPQCLGCCALMGIAIALVWFEPEKEHFLPFLVKVLGTALFFGFLSLGWQKGTLRKS